MLVFIEGTGMEEKLPIDGQPDILLVIKITAKVYQTRAVIFVCHWVYAGFTCACLAASRLRAFSRRMRMRRVVLWSVGSGAKYFRLCASKG